MFAIVEQGGGTRRLVGQPHTTMQLATTHYHAGRNHTQPCSSQPHTTIQLATTHNHQVATTHNHRKRVDAGVLTPSDEVLVEDSRSHCTCPKKQRQLQRRLQGLLQRRLQRLVCSTPVAGSVPGQPTGRPWDRPTRDGTHGEKTVACP